ncbi:HEPACAM family member 2 [Grus japonensis]|uniref:HEPACAM family member 2 n=1 Tax=Grus japonensis TaxID=30415 RepID=A0ABC9WJ37_GRUJA
MFSWSPLANFFWDLQCKIYVLLVGICSALKLTVPSHTIHGIEGQPLHLAVDYNFNATASEIQIIWLFERPHSNPKYLLGSVNQTVVPDLEYQHKFTLTPPNASLMINPLHMSDEGNYIVKVNVRGNGTIAASQKIQVAVDDGPYGLRVKSDKGLNVGAVFTVDMGEVILFDCSADSNPPNTYSWIQRADNTTHVIKYGPHLEVVSDKVAQKTIDYMCRAFNNVTGKRDETHFTVVVTSVGLEKLAQKGKSLSSLAVITGISLFLILAMAFLFLWKRYQPHKGHESALDDFGIYEFVAIPDLASGSRVSSQSVPSSDFVPGQDMLSTVYEVIQHIPEQPQQDHQQNPSDSTSKFAD